MAGTLVGGAFLSASLQVLFDRMASRQVLDFLKGQNLDTRLLKKLKTKMITVNKVRDDAEDKQHTDLNVKQWLDELKDAVYEAEDLLDEIGSEVQRLEMEAESQTALEKVQDFASSCNPFKTGKKEKLEEILETLEDLIHQKDSLGLIDGIGEKPSFQRTPTTSIPDESVTYGRDADKDAIMEWMLSDDVNDGNPDVLAIVGMGGLGKTTLAQDVYRDSRTDDWFNRKTWVCVSEEFNVLNLTKDILEGFTKSSPNTNNLDQLQNTLKDDLTGKKFFLVLDDVWNKDYLKWQDLLKSLKFGIKGSKILVTAREEGVAKNMQTSSTHKLEKLRDNDCWLLFEKHACIGTGSSSAHEDLTRIGRKLIEKCDGLPLAAKVLGGALRSERDPKEWMKILESDTWNLHQNSIFEVLKLSYRFLPSHLKRCFAYCALFPKDYEFKKEQLIRLWVAEGLLTQPNPKKIEDVEQAGEEYFDDLVSRSFFQQSMERECFLMHDLISDFAKSISGEFYFRLGVDRSSEIPKRIRHLWVEKATRGEVHNQISALQCLHTFLLRGQWWHYNIDREMQHFLSTFSRLRVLSLPYYKMIELPDSLGSLIHLRYLDLSHSSIERLPDSVVSLSYLETLIMYRCRGLVELPDKISKLTNLCHLDIRGTKLRKMPPHMGKLKKLGELAYFIVGKQSDCSSIKELGELKRLRGLRIKELRNVLQVEECEEAKLKCKKKLKVLELEWNDGGNEDSLHERNVLEKLRPHTNIEQLSIYGYAGIKFPDWVGDSSFSNMVELKLESCRYCSSLPPLGQLGSLKSLSIVGLDGIRVVGPEFYGNGNKPPFGCLKRLEFRNMTQWQEWVPYTNMEKGADSLSIFPLLESLAIEGCPNLKAIQSTLLPSLTTLAIHECRQLASLPRAPAILEFRIVDDSRFMTLDKLHSSSSRLTVSLWSSADSPLEILEQMLECPNTVDLKHLRVTFWVSLTSFPLDLFPTLESLEIFNCPNLESLSAATSQAPLQSLKLSSCPNLKCLPRCISSLFPSLVKLQICHCPLVVDSFPNLTELSLAGEEGSWYKKVESFPLENMLLPSTLTSLEIRDFPNVRLLDNESFQSLTCLTKLKILFCTNLREAWLPPTLTSLEIADLENLESLDNWGLHRLTSLTQLEIFRCPNLQPLANMSLQSLTSLRELMIVNCPNLGGVSLPPALNSLQISFLENMESLDNWGLHRLTSLTQLEIFRCPNLQPLANMSLQSLTSLRELKTGNCSNLGRESLLPPALNSLEISSFKNLESLDNWGLHRLTSLTQLRIFSCPNLREACLPPTLTSLEISDLKNLESLDNWGLHRLTSLTQLWISECPKLQSIPKEGLPSSLLHVAIINCPLLKVGQDWPFNPPENW